MVFLEILKLYLQKFWYCDKGKFWSMRCSCWQWPCHYYWSVSHSYHLRTISLCHYLPQTWHQTCVVVWVMQLCFAIKLATFGSLKVIQCVDSRYIIREEWLGFNITQNYRYRYLNRKLEFFIHNEMLSSKWIFTIFLQSKIRIMKCIQVYKIVMKIVNQKLNITYKRY